MTDTINIYREDAVVFLKLNRNRTFNAILT